jgi:DNA-binding YbaB/EbfC family protein
LEKIMAKGGKVPEGMLRQLQQLQQQLLEAQAQLAEESVTGDSGGGAVKITITGDQRCTAVEVDPELLKDADAEMLQDLIQAAFNNALEASRELAQQRLGPLSGGLPF